MIKIRKYSRIFNSVLSSSRSLKTRWHRVHNDKKKKVSWEVNIKLPQCLSKSFINNAIRGVVLLTSGRKNVCNVSVLKKMTNSYLKTIVQYLYCQSALKFWRDYSATQCLSFSSKTTWSHVSSPVLKQYQLTYFHHLWNIQLIRWQLFTSCAQVHDLPQSDRGDNREGTLFSWLNTHYAHLASVRFERSVCRFTDLSERFYENISI